MLQAFAQVQRFAPDQDSSTHHFPISMGGAGLDSLTRHARGNFLGTYYRIAGPLYERIWRVGFGVNLDLAGHLARPEVSQTTQPWAWHLVVTLVSYEEAKVLEASFSQAEHELANMMLPRGNVITDAGDPDSVNLESWTYAGHHQLRGIASFGASCGEASWIQVYRCWTSASGRVEILHGYPLQLFTI